MSKHDQPNKLLRRNHRLYLGSNHELQTRPWLKKFLVVALMLVFIVGAYGFRLYSQASHAWNNSYVGNGKPSAAIAARKPVTILLLGIDTGGLGRKDRGNSDTIIVATINPQTKKTLLMSVPRDTLAKIYRAEDGTHTTQKVNAAYRLGRAPGAKATVQKLLNISIDHYLTVDFHSLPKVVDAVGGIEVDSPFKFRCAGIDFKKGKQQINGKQSLAYARMRYNDPRGDYGRQYRQRQVITAIVKKALSLNTLPNISQVMGSLSSSMSTDLSMTDILALAQSYQDAAKKITSDHLQGHSLTIDQAAYEVMATKELQRASDKVRTYAGSEPETLENAETELNYLNKMRNNFSFANGDNQNYTIYNQEGMQYNPTQKADAALESGTISNY
ncbi:LCP family protein [Lactobacillus sp. DCY120]|uniref:LCP family protein n=1 Tax=Bombilactobacillus apium TaxID=2675299 RepID=A0A850RBK4_9LACO|nr:LCP family protein [Bombilactobacillus apium]NVY96696.1 LCP family protein [Bombilactobacillus apium]